ADMEAGDRPALHAGDHRIVGLDRAAEALQRVLALRLPALQRRRIDVAGVGRLADLDVVAAGVHQLLYHLPLDGDDVGEKRIGAVIDRARLLDVAHLADAVRAHQRDLGRRLRYRLQELQFLEREAALELEARGGRRAERDDGIFALRV